MMGSPREVLEDSVSEEEYNLGEEEGLMIVLWIELLGTSSTE